MSRSVKLPQRPAFARSTNSNVLVSTYQLEDPDSRSGSIFVLSPALDIVHCITAPAGVFRFDFLKEDVLIAAITDGSLFTTTLTESPSSDSIPVAEEMLLDVSSPSSSNSVACTDKAGCAHLVDVNTGTVVASWKAHSLPYTNTGCEVWTCALNDTLLCTGGEDSVLKVWDVRTQSIVQRFSEFHAGVTFSGWEEDHVIVTGSYDQHIRLFDMRKSQEPLKVNETSGGVWHIEDYQYAGAGRYLAACMYGGWALFDEKFDVVKADEKAGVELLYGVTTAAGDVLVYTTFNDYKVTAVTV